jgi:hypothetical protein
VDNSSGESRRHRLINLLEQPRQLCSRESLRPAVAAPSASVANHFGFGAAGHDASGIYEDPVRRSSCSAVSCREVGSARLVKKAAPSRKTELDGWLDVMKIEFESHNATVVS